MESSSSILLMQGGPPPALQLGRSGISPTASAAETEGCKRGDNAPDEEERKFLDLVSNKNMKLAERVIIPVKQHPKFNFVGKLLGPRGNSLKRMQEETGTKMSILGKGSMRDKALEEEMRKSGENKYAHLSEELHVLIEVFAPPSEAYSRMGHALDEVKKYLVPDYNDEIRQEQLRELSYLKGDNEEEMRAESQGRGGGLIRGLVASMSTHSRAAVRMVAAQQGPPIARALPPPLTVGKAALPPPRAWPGPVYRALPPSPPPPLAQEAYEEDYDYGNGYIAEYEDSFDCSFSSQTQSASEYYAGYGQEEYESYGENGWAGSNGHLKALPNRAVKAAFREHPYGR